MVLLKMIEGRSKCNYCGKVVSGGIYRLKQHLARVSREVTYCNKAPEEAFLRMKRNLEGSRFIKKVKQANEGGLAYLSYHYEDEEEHGEYRGKGKQLMGDCNLEVKLTPLRLLEYVDPGWEHGCKYCEKVVIGGIHRFKQHLARIPGEVAPCRNSPQEVYLKIKENMKWHHTGGRQRQVETKEISSSCKESDDEDGEDELLSKDISFKRIVPDGNFELQLKRSRLDPILDDTSSSYMPSFCKSYLCNLQFFYHAGVPLEAANSPCMQHKMLDLVGQYGEVLVDPQKEIATIKNYLVEYKVSWATTGCSIIADNWMAIEGKTSINLSVSSPHGVYFVASVDASDLLEHFTSLFNLLDKLIEEMGEEHMVQVITRNTPCYKAAGKMLEERRRNLFWTPCATHCIDQILEEFMKIKCVGDCMVKGQKITKLIYSNIWLLNLMKQFTQGKELLRLSATCYSRSFATLQSLLDNRTSLKRMGKEVENIVSNATFWKKVHYTCKSVGPVMQVLGKVDSGENLSMACIYGDMYNAKLAIKSFLGDDAYKNGLFWSVLDNQWSSPIYHPLYLASYILNPSYRYHSDFVAHSEVVHGLHDCILRLEQDSVRRISAFRQISDYVSAKDDFGTELAISTRTELDPAAWWQQHGISCLELHRVAVRILSQTCSSFLCEHSWSIYDRIHSQRHHHLPRKRLDDLVFVHYNLRLRECQLKKMTTFSFILTLYNVNIDKKGYIVLENYLLK
ncbi:hypothetical protein K2173_003403 [Erythroxylum novogranatense]|uniref:BED-type domain-containing protein n=1 Tax=Erythroxylum novogranatense TaxID=1862640 RepID=A0AAV8S8Y6_9ROSI|nr:hypothetical protein K2173_003403 [Erythroxylum novogranatense]